MYSTGNRISWLQGPDANCAKTGPVAPRPWHLVLLGPPGVGKGTQAERIIAEFGACHLSTGDVFRYAAHDTSGHAPSPAMATALAAMKKGELVSDGTVVDLVRERAQCLACQYGFLLDGFPRTIEQARALEGILATVKRGLDAVIYYTAPEALIVERLSGRRVCRQCRTGYHVVNKPPRVAGRCDVCGGELMQRDDDKPEAIRVRLQAYAATCDPVLNYYRQRGLLREIDGSGDPETVFARTRAVIQGLIRSSRPRKKPPVIPSATA
jgi:adenylate kinase